MTGPGRRIAGWAAAARTVEDVDELAAAFGADPGSGRRLGHQWLLAPPAGLNLLEFVVDRGEGGRVLFAEVRFSLPVSVSELAAELGPGHEVLASPHDPAPTLVFPAEPGGRCEVMARLDAPAGEDATASTVVIRAGASA